MSWARIDAVPLRARDVRMHEHPDGWVPVFLGPHRRLNCDLAGTLVPIPSADAAA